MRTDPRADQVRRLVAEVLAELGDKDEGGRMKDEGRRADRLKSGRANFPLPSSFIPLPSSFIPLPSSFIPPPSFRETILIDAGRYVARSYRTDEHLAMWLVEVGLVQFYNAEGDMLLTVNLFDRLTGQRMAA